MAEELSFARASKRLFIAQPALSIQIRNLEIELKVKLLRRTTRAVELTHAGRTFYADAKEVLARSETAVKHVRDAEQGVVGTLRVALLANVATANLGGRMRSFRERFPGVNLTLMEAPSHAQIALLRRGEIDVAFLRMSRLPAPPGAELLATGGRDGLEELASIFGFSSQELAVEAVGLEPMVVAVPAGGALARKLPLAWADFQGEAMIGTPDTRERFFEAFFACCERAGVQPVLSQYAQDLLTRLWMVACGFGFTPTSASSQEISRPGLIYRPLPPDGPEVLTFAAWVKHAAPSHLKQFIQTIRGPRNPPQT